MPQKNAKGLQNFNDSASTELEEIENLNVYWMMMMIVMMKMMIHLMTKICKF